MQDIIVEAADDGQRLDRFLKIHCSHLNYGTTQRLIRQKTIRVNGARAKTDMRLSAGDVVKVPNQDAASPVKRPAKQLLYVLYEDQWLMIINKPSGLATQGGTNITRSLDDMLPGGHKLVHRLDKDTSGAVLIAKSRAMAEQLSALFKDHSITKTYWAVVEGQPKQRVGTINLPLYKNHEQVVVDEERGKPALTDYEKVKTHKRWTWLQLQPQHGRTHQLRVHCAAMRMPIKGDGKYGKAGKDQLHLHARTVRFIHPETYDPIEVHAPLPSHIAETFTLCGWDSMV